VLLMVVVVYIVFTPFDQEAVQEELVEFGWLATNVSTFFWVGAVESLLSSNLEFGNSYQLGREVGSDFCAW
jgi:hypothetical protein